MNSTLTSLPLGIPVPQLIIDRPDLQPRQQRAVFAVITAMFWVLWVVLWLPLITLMGWAFFGYQLHFHMIALDGYHGFLEVLGLYTLVIVIMSGGLMVWAKYNHLRFRGVDRRKSFAAPTPADLGRVHGRSADDIAHWQTLNIVTVHHDASGRILSVVS
jgi:biofilm PGA synthesis protein PgaD